MSGLDAISVKNLRALADTGFINLRPITLLVGKNSVGKSTFARIFPLLRQSVEENRKAPLLWWGKYVDFGTFEDAVNRSCESRDIKFGFRFPVSVTRNADDTPGRQSLPLVDATTFETELTIKQQDANTYVSHVLVRAFDLECTVDISADGIVEKIQCGQAVWSSNAANSDIGITFGGDIFPDISFYRRVKAQEGEKNDSYRSIDLLGNRLSSVIQHYSHGNTTSANLATIGRRIPIGTAENVLRAIKSISGPETWRKNTATFSLKSYGFKTLREWSFIARINKILGYFNEELTRFSAGVRYLEPLRATAQRYYRSQELSIDEIDSKGANIAMLLYSMTTPELKAFNRWIGEHLGINVVARKEGGHVSLKIRSEDDEDETNLADVGFGLSQVLPIATQIWSSTSPIRRKRMRNAPTSTCFVVEQPELHLHPAFQARIADLFVGAVENKPDSTTDAPFYIIAETHSSSLINRLGELVAEQKIDKSKVQVVLFDQASSKKNVSIKIAEFDEEGILQNWPVGFFSSGVSE